MAYRQFEDVVKSRHRSSKPALFGKDGQAFYPQDGFTIAKEESHLLRPARLDPIVMRSKY
jgi:hypothetical protein